MDVLGVLRVSALVGNTISRQMTALVHQEMPVEWHVSAGPLTVGKWSNDWALPGIAWEGR